MVINVIENGSQGIFETIVFSRHGPFAISNYWKTYNFQRGTLSSSDQPLLARQCALRMVPTASSVKAQNAIT